MIVQQSELDKLGLQSWPTDFGPRNNPITYRMLRRHDHNHLTISPRAKLRFSKGTERERPAADIGNPRSNRAADDSSPNDGSHQNTVTQCSDDHHSNRKRLSVAGVARPAPSYRIPIKTPIAAPTLAIPSLVPITSGERQSSGTTAAGTEIRMPERSPHSIAHTISPGLLYTPIQPNTKTSIARGLHVEDCFDFVFVGDQAEPSKELTLCFWPRKGNRGESDAGLLSRIH